MISTLRPNSLNSAGSWDVFSGTFLPNISDGVLTVASSVYNTDGNDEFNVAFDNLSAQAASINSIEASMYYSRSSAGLSADIQQYVRIGGDTVSDSVQTSPDNAIYLRSFNPARPGGGSYFPTDINSMTGGCVSSDGDPGEEVYCYDLLWTVNWNAYNGFFVWLVLGALGNLTNVLPREIPGMAREIYHKTRAIITPSEYGQMLREIKMPRPVYFA